MPATRRSVGNLPSELTSFVGRRRELAEAKRLLSAARLLTLTGTGGVGKTRLALRVAADVRRAFPDGVWLGVPHLGTPVGPCRHLAPAVRRAGLGARHLNSRAARLPPPALSGRARWGADAPPRIVAPPRSSQLPRRS